MKIPGLVARRVVCEGWWGVDGEVVLLAPAATHEDVQQVGARLVLFLCLFGFRVLFVAPPTDEMAGQDSGIGVNGR